MGVGRKRAKALGIAALLVAFLLLPAGGAPAASRAPVTVVRVLDGDTVEVRAGAERQRVRLLGVDTPEVAHRDRPGEPFGRAATRYTRNALASARSVELEVAGDRIDAHGRTLGFLWVWVPGRSEPVNLSEDLLRQGLGRAIRHFEYPGKLRFIAIEQEARRAHRGLWR